MFENSNESGIKTDLGKNDQRTNFDWTKQLLSITKSLD